MPGTLAFEITPLHIYQRKFNSSDLEEALRFSHIYLITRRPATRIVHVSTESGSAHFRFEGYYGEQERRFGSTQVLNFHNAPILSAQTHENGEYFSVKVNDSILHGDSWSLLSYFMNTRGAISWHEVMYVGMSYGKDGERNVSHRIRKHSTLQKIYEDHARTNWDIFVTPIEVNGNTLNSADHIDDEDDDDDSSNYDLVHYLEYFAQPSPIFESRTKVSKQSIELIEHALISAFKPPYNENKLEWDPRRPTKSMKTAQDVGARLLGVHLRGWRGLARFFSESVPKTPRSHFFTYPLSTHPHPGPLGKLPPGLFGTNMIYQQAAAGMIEDDEHSGTVISIFGEDAPKVRRPPRVRLAPKSVATPD